MSLTSAPFYREPTWVRPTRFLALLLLALVVTFLSTLALLSTFPTLHASIDYLMSSETDAKVPKLAGWFTVAFIVLVPTALLVAMWRFRLRSWWWVGGGWLVVMPVLVYLAVDEPTIRHPLTLEEISPAFSGAEKSYEVLMRYGKAHPLGKAFVEPPSVWAGKSPREPAVWREAILANRAKLEARWIELAPLRAWWTEVNTFDRIADLTPPSISAELLAFQPVRAMSQQACAAAGLLALDGHGDAAIDTLLPIVQVGRKLQPSGRTLVRLMIGIVIERLALDTAHFVLDTTPVSPAARARLAAALTGGNDEAGARRLILSEYAMNLGGLLEMPLSASLDLTTKHPWLGHLVDAIGPFVYNRRASFNTYGEFMFELQELIARREISKMSPREVEFFNASQPRFKNFLGSFMIRLAVPAYTKVTKSYWDTVDTRTKLAARLAQP